MLNANSEPVAFGDNRRYIPQNKDELESKELVPETPEEKEIMTKR